MLTAMRPMHPSTLRYLTNRDIAEEYDDYFGQTPLFAYDTELLGRWLHRPGRVLDVGCGTARHVIFLARQGHRVVGVDLSEHMLAVACRKVHDAGVDAALIRADMMDLRALFAPGSFDYAICMFSTLGLIAGHANRRSFVMGIAEVLRPGGLLAVHVHNRWRGLTRPDGLHFLLTSLWQTYSGKAEFGDKILRQYRGIRNMYVHIFSRRELEDLLTSAGFVVRTTIPLNSRRSGPLRLGLLAGIRANGYIALAERTGA